MKESIIDLSLIDLTFAYALILLAIGLGRLRGVGQEREMLWASVRMVVQLLAVGQVLHLVFALKNPLAVLFILLLMGAFAVQTIAGRVKERMPGFYRTVSISMATGCGGATLFFCYFLIGLSPWYDPRYLIPLAGMILGNSMTGASLAAERLAVEMRERREEIETALCLGATARVASRPALSAALRAALIPSLNSMAAMGLVFLPGMMTGQILSGTEPVTAVKYQIAVMCVITGSVALTSFLILIQGYRSYFTPDHQFRDSNSS